MLNLKYIFNTFKEYSFYMAGTILTPKAIWGDFVIDKPIESRSIGVYNHGDIQIERMYLTGKTFSDGNVQIYTVMARNIKKENAPAIFILQKFSDGADEKLATDLAKRGYCAFVVDISGEDGINNNHTTYPKSLSFTTYINAENSLFSIGSDVKNTCWYEWGCTARYALQYLKQQPFVTNIAGLGIDDASTVLWHIAGTDKTFSCVSFILNAGWGKYMGNYKFAKTNDEELSEEQLKFLAGIAPQTYAGQVSCPTFIAVATNSNKYDFDRAHDTYSRIQEGVYKTLHYSVGRIDGVDNKAYDNLLTFFDSFIPLEGQPNNNLPNGLEIKSELINGKFVVTLNPDTDGIKKLSLYASEQVINPSLRQWQKISDCVRTEDGAFSFDYLPYNYSGIVMFFGVAEYKNGFEVGSAVIAKRFESGEVNLSHKNNVIYSSRQKDAYSAFYPLKGLDNKPSGLSIKPHSIIKEKKGAMDIVGVSLEYGLLSFKLLADRYKPQESAMLMLDIYSKKDCNITIRFFEDFYGNKKEYFATASVKGGEVWNNLKFELKNFKTNENLNLKSFEKIQAFTIESDSDCLVNNLLWV